MQLGDLIVRKAEFLEHFVGVLADVPAARAAILLGVRDSVIGWPTKVIAVCRRAA